jgi:Cytochrome oxidase complex assembly protein 1
MVQHVRQLGGLMIAQGILSCGVGFISLAVGPLNLIFLSKQRSDFPFFGKVVPWLYIVSGLLILTSGVLNILAGVKVRRFQNRPLAIVALATNAVYLFSFFNLPCFPIALALMIFGLVVVLNQDVRRAFDGTAESSGMLQVTPSVVTALPADKPDWFGRNWKWLVPSVVLLPVLALGGCGGCLFFVFSFSFKSSGAYQSALARVQADPDVIAALGSPVEPGLFTYSGTISEAGPIGHAEAVFPISGPKGSGKVHLEADKSDGKWDFKVLEVTVDGTDTPINLLDK